MGTKKRQTDHSMGGDSSDSNPENVTKCPHWNKSVIPPFVKKELVKSGLPKECVDCKRAAKNGAASTTEEGETESSGLYICLRCGQCKCQNHAEKHAEMKQEPHDVGLLLADEWIIRCFKCKAEVNENTKNLSVVIDQIKKLREKTSSDASTSESAAIPLEYTGSFFIASVPVSATGNDDRLPQVRGLANLGNTCFFNSVMQCLAQTPFLLDILEEMHEEGEKFRLPGGEVQMGEEKINLDPLEGTLKDIQSSTLTHSLINALRELRSGSSEVYVPRQLREKLQDKCPQFAGYDQHDAHELLRQLLETVRNEDLDRYKKAILQELDLDKRSNREAITDEQAREVKAYGRQAGDLLLRPSQVFRGELVSTLRRIQCGHTTDHIEHFLDLSLPVSADKPVHTRRRANSENNETNEKPSKYQLKKEQRKQHRGKRRNKFLPVTNVEPENGNVSNSSGDNSDADNEEETEPRREVINEIAESGYSSEKPCNGDSGCGSPSESQLNQSGQLDENSVLVQNTLNVTGGRVEPYSNEHVNAGLCHDAAAAEPPKTVLQDDSMSVDDDDPNLQKLHRKRLDLNLTIPLLPCSDPTGERGRVEPYSHQHVNSGLCHDAAAAGPPKTVLPDDSMSVNGDDTSLHKLHRKPLDLNLTSPIPLPPCSSPTDEINRVRLEVLSNGIDKLMVGAVGDSTPDSDLSGIVKVGDSEQPADTPMDSSEGQGECAGALPGPPSPPDSVDADDMDMDISQVDGDLLEDMEKRTLAPRQIGSENKCTLITCLNSFTAAELLTNNNKVSCDECTAKLSKRNPGKSSQTVYSDASKQLLILNPPAILILHLKRFQVQRLFSRKNSETVTFEPILDLAPYCSVKCRNSGLVRKDQTQIRYALYGIVQHSGGMHGGHYVAHVKVRKALTRDDPRWNFLAPGPSKTRPIAEEEIAEPPAAPPGKWYYVSDSQVHEEAKEARVLNSEAYLLFYERIW